jgi:hypothetical protein
MAATMEHPDIRYVVCPVRVDGTPTGAKPRLRHDPDCSHFEWGDGTVLGTPQLATGEQMQSLRACKTCIGTRRGPRNGGRDDRHDGRTGRLCPTFNQTMSLTGVCDSCTGPVVGTRYM